MDNVKVTVPMPVYNGERYISTAIRSVLSQTFRTFELLIVNDGSTDRTGEIIRSFNDDRIVVLEQRNGGVASALNMGLVHSKGNYIARFDADDICRDERLDEQVGFLDQHADHVVVGSDAEYIMEDGEHLFNFHCLGHTHEEIMKNLYFYCPFIHSSVMYRKDAVMQAGGYSVHAYNFEGYLLWSQLVKMANLQIFPIP